VVYGKRESLAVKRPSGARKRSASRRQVNHPGGRRRRQPRAGMVGIYAPGTTLRGYEALARRPGGRRCCLDAAVPSLTDAFHRQRARHVRPTAGAAATGARLTCRAGRSRREGGGRVQPEQATAPQPPGAHPQVFNQNHALLEP
jgi:hypothetical protein